MQFSRPARRTRQVLAACLVLTVVALGSFAVAATVLAPAAAAQTPPGGEGDGSGPTADLPRTATGDDGFVVLGLALAATVLVALVMALRNRGIARERRRPVGWDRATGRAARPLPQAPVTARSRYSSRSRR